VFSAPSPFREIELNAWPTHTAPPLFGENPTHYISSPFGRGWVRVKITPWLKKDPKSNK